MPNGKLMFVSDMAPWSICKVGRGARPPLRDREKFYGYLARADSYGEGCWLWTAGRFRYRTPRREFGYGAFVMHTATNDTKTLAAHRYSWMLHRGPIPAGMNVLHKCDNPPCVNPHHLFLGTQKDNMQDMVSKGRKFLTVGAYKSSSKLTQAQVGEYRRRHIAGESVRSLARGMDINPRSLFDALHGVTWKHLTATEDQPCSMKHKQGLAATRAASRLELS